MSKPNTKRAVASTKYVPEFDGHPTVAPISTIEIANTAESNSSGSDPDSKPCKTKLPVQSKIENFQFQIARGWLDAGMAASYLGISRKTLYNLRYKGWFQSAGHRRLIFRLADLDLALEKLKGIK